MNQEFSLLLGLFEAAEPAGEFDAVLCEALAEAFGAERAAIFDVDETSGTLRFRCAPNLSPEVMETFRFRLGEGICGAAALSGRTIAVFDASRRPEHQHRVDEATGLTTRSLLAAPALHQGRCLAVIEVMNRRDGTFDETDQRLARAMAALYAARLARLSPSRRQAVKEGTETAATDRPGADPLIIGASVALQEVMSLVFKAGPSDLPVLILGETGTGKELVARRLHELSARRKRRCVTINCAALSETLLESELFGHLKGAFTGALRDRRGLLQEADGGTVFLDEVGDMSPACQARLLRALDYGEITPVGGNRPVQIDVRILAATNRPLQAQIDRGKFRADLYHRLCGMEIVLPPLRERPEDIPLLAEYFLKSMASPSGDPRIEIKPDALTCLLNYHWPGNVRELKRVLERGVVMSASRRIQMGHLSFKIQDCLAGRKVRKRSVMAPEQVESEAEKSEWQIDFAELNAIRAALETTAYPGSGRWNMAKAARKLGLPRKTLEYKVRKLYRLRG